MAKIFLSHSSKNNREALAMKVWLGGRTKYFWISIQKRVSSSGSAGRMRWRKPTKQSDALLCLTLPEWIESGECEVEYRIAKGNGNRIFSARIAPFDDFDKTREWENVRLFGEGPTTEISIGPKATGSFSC